MLTIIEDAGKMNRCCRILVFLVNILTVSRAELVDVIASDTGLCRESGAGLAVAALSADCRSQQNRFGQ